METPVSKIPRRKKPNSPKAPGSSLRGAVADISKIYQRYSHGVFSRGEMASALGMSSGSGAFFGKASTFKEYGLVRESGGSAQVSDLFKAIYQAPAGSAELKRNALQAIRTAAVFARLLQQFSTKIPDEAALALRLENQERFNRDRATAVASAFRASLSEYSLIDVNGNLLPVRDEPISETAPGERTEDLEETDEPDTIVGSAQQRLEVSLRDGRKAVLVVPDDLSVADTKKISAVLTALAADYGTDE